MQTLYYYSNQIKIYANPLDLKIINKFLDQWIPSKPNKIEQHCIFLLTTKEFEGFRFDSPDQMELNNAIMELEKKGFVQSVKEVFQGNIFYRSDTEKCSRCYRYRPEVYYDKSDNNLCDRCKRCTITQTKGD